MIKKISELKTILINSPQYTHKDSCAILELFLEHYKSIRIAETVLEEDGDMLLYQWGHYSFGEKEYFEIDCTRQIIPYNKDADYSSDNMQQLKLVFKFKTNQIAKSFGNSNQWCGSPTELKNLKKFIYTSQAFSYLLTHEADSIDLELTKI